MVNCNPETVSTDYDTSDRLYFEPLTHEDVLNVIEAEAPPGEVAGVIVALGGQTPLKLADLLPAALCSGTSPDAIDLAEDRERWNALAPTWRSPSRGGTATTPRGGAGRRRAGRLPGADAPVLRARRAAMEIVYDDEGLRGGHGRAGRLRLAGQGRRAVQERPVLIDRFLEDAIEVDVDAIRDHTGDCLIGGVMEHVEEAGVHSGDSACVIPPPTLSDETLAVIEAYTRAIAEALDVRGLINVQYAVKADQVFVIEANPRASRTVPFVAKATGVPLVKVAARVMLGATLGRAADEGLLREPVVATTWR